MPKKKELSEQDLSLFHEAMRGIKPISYSKVNLKPVIKKPILNKSQLREVEAFHDTFSDYETLPPVTRDDLIEYSKPGLQHKTLRNLRNGKYNVEATLDLHGQTVIEARQALSRFLTQCHINGFRNLLIIHGKGNYDNVPVLKNKLNHWLRQTELVLAFCSASIYDGRSGSLYVLLKGRS